MNYSAKKIDDDRWEIWQSVDMGGKRQMCTMTVSDIIDLYETIVPEFKETVLVSGEPGCRHTWTPYQINHSIKTCNKCPAMMKIERLVPRHIKEN